MITRHVTALMRAVELCEEACPPMVLALPPNSRLQLAVSRLLTAAAEVSAALGNGWEENGVAADEDDG